jgi:hypothetical protein
MTWGRVCALCVKIGEMKGVFSRLIAAAMAVV